METIRFDELNLDPRILRAVTDMGFEAASPIQAQAIPVEMEGHDMIGQAQTGTGKTAAFSIPIIQRLYLQTKKGYKRGIKALILTPTRELAIQIGESFAAYGRFAGLRHIRRGGTEAPDGSLGKRHRYINRYAGTSAGLDRTRIHPLGYLGVFRLRRGGPYVGHGLYP